jgi:5-methylcytosine-specific restriction endonuclease McrA
MVCEYMCKYTVINVKMAQWQRLAGPCHHFPNQCFKGAIGMSNSDSTETKKCTKCGFEKSVSLFYSQKTGRNGLAAACKACANADNSARQSAKPDKRKAYFQDWAKLNGDRIKAIKISYQVRNPEKVKQSKEKWLFENDLKRKEVCSAYRKANPEQGVIHTQNRRSRKLSAGGKLSAGLAKKLFKLQKSMCPCCKKPLGEKYHLDHIHPLSLGGENSDSNMQLLRSTCNQQKHAKHPIDFMQSRGFLL